MPTATLSRSRASCSKTKVGKAIALFSSRPNRASTYVPSRRAWPGFGNAAAVPNAEANHQYQRSADRYYCAFCLTLSST
jgi:hypothetical protein